MSNERIIEDRIRAMLEMAGGRQDFTGEVMDEILTETGCTQKELESVLTSRFIPLNVGRFGMPNIWTLPSVAGLSHGQENHGRVTD